MQHNFKLKKNQMKLLSLTIGVLLRYDFD